MSYVLGVMAAVVSFMLNRALFKKIGGKTIVSYSPVIEESCKSIPAYFLQADILVVHLIFGVIEGAYEFFFGGAGKLAVFLSVTGHCLFGLSAVTILMLTGSIYLAMLASILFHLLWNVVVVRFF